MKIFRASHLLSKGALFVDYVNGDTTKVTRAATAVTRPNMNKAVNSSVNRGNARLGSAMAGGKKSASVSAAGATSEETTVISNKNLANSDDPIAFAIQ